jgi:hypothetical protein
MALSDKPASEIVEPTLILNGRVAIAFVGCVSIMITKVDQWTPADIITLLEETTRLGGYREDTRAFTHYFGAAFGADATQRKQLVEWQANNNTPPVSRVTNITDSAIMRAAMTAYAWMTKTNAKAFKSSELDTACRWLTEDSAADPEKVKIAIMASYKLLGKPPG